MNVKKYWGPEKEKTPLCRREPNEYGDPLFPYWPASYHEFIEKKHYKILDIGCGCGYMMKFLRDKGHDVTGVTYSPQEVEECRKSALNVIEADMHELPFGDEEFNAIIMWDALEHSCAPIIALGEIRRVLKIGGIGLIYVPGQNWIECSYHIIVPTFRQMNHLLWLADFEILDTKYGSGRARLEAGFRVSKDNKTDFVATKRYYDYFQNKLQKFMEDEFAEGSQLYVIRKPGS